MLKKYGVLQHDVFQLVKPNDDKQYFNHLDKVVSANLQGPLKENTIPDLVNLINTTQTYVNIHSVEYPNGEIRGQITTVNAMNWWN